MHWFYAEDGQQRGPVEDAQFEALIRQGKVQSETLVWHEGMPNWQPAREVVPESLRELTVAGSRPESVPPLAAVAPAGNQAVCAECGGIFNVQDMIAYENMHVCAKCKPVLLQKLAEGARLNTGALAYAGFWTRFAAVVVDGMILWVVNFAISMAAGNTMFFTVAPQPVARLNPLFFVLVFIQIGIALSYEAVLIGKYGATLGKMACKIKVVRPDGGRVSYPRAFGRYFAKMISGFACMLGYIMAAVDEENRALHDRICDTRVVLR